MQQQTQNLNAVAESDRQFSRFKISCVVPVQVCALVLINHYVQVHLDFITLPLVCGWLAYVVHRYLSAVQYQLVGSIVIPIIVVGSLLFLSLILAGGYFLYTLFPSGVV